jgi:hypothetical protein
MKNNAVALFSLFFACTVYAANDQPVIDIAHKTNGCGTEEWKLLVPDKTFISGCNFLDACNKHDLCYARCLPGGDLKGPTCADESDKSIRRKQCDAQLQKNIINNNPNKPLCGMYASIYRWAVSTFGKSSFAGIISASGSQDALLRFLKFVEENPKSFNYSEVEKSFELMNNAAIDERAYIVIFVSDIPRLEVFSFNKDGKEMIHHIKMKGIRGGPR